MPGAVEQVAALEAETAEAVAAAQVAQEAAASAVASAAVLENQVVIEAAQHAAELETEVAQNKDELQWLKDRMTGLESSQATMMGILDTMSATLLALTTEPEAPSTASQSATLETPPPSSAVVVDLQAAENPASSPAAEKPSPKPKRHRLV